MTRRRTTTPPDAPIEPAATRAASPHGSDAAYPAAWAPPTRVLFRFGVLYLGLFTLATQFSGSLLPNTSFYYRGLGPLWPMRDITFWIAGHLAGAPLPIEEATSGGEPLFFWVQTGWLLAVAAFGTVVWSALDRRKSYPRAHAWFRLCVRFVLAAQMFEYGMTKVIPTQFPAPSLETLVTPVGDLTLSAVLWTAIGSSPAYQIFTGCVEVLGGLLLLLPRTTVLGALISLAAAIQIFALNMTFDIGLKVISFHLIVLALVLLAPQWQRLLDVFVLNRATAPAFEWPLARTPQGQRRALIAQLIVGTYLVATYAFINVEFWNVGGGGRPRSAIHGIWNIERMTIDGQEQPAVLNDYDRRWRRVIFDEPQRVTFQRTDDSLARYDAALDVAGGTLEISKRASRSWRTRFTLQRPADDRLQLHGEMDGKILDLQLRRAELDTFKLLSSPFRWVRLHKQD